VRPDYFTWLAAVCTSRCSMCLCVLLSLPLPRWSLARRATDAAQYCLLIDFWRALQPNELQHRRLEPNRLHIRNALSDKCIIINIRFKYISTNHYAKADVCNRCCLYVVLSVCLSVSKITHETVYRCRPNMVKVKV